MGDVQVFTVNSIGGVVEHPKSDDDNFSFLSMFNDDRHKYNLAIDTNSSSYSHVFSEKERNNARDANLKKIGDSILAIISQNYDTNTLPEDVAQNWEELVKLKAKRQNVVGLLSGVEVLGSVEFSFIFGAFSHPHYVDKLLSSSVGTGLFVAAAAFELVTVGLLVDIVSVDSKIAELEEKLIAKALGISNVKESPIKRRENLNESRAALAISSLKMTLVLTAVIGSKTVPSVFATALPHLQLAGGLTPLLFIIAMGATAIYQFGCAAYFLNKSSNSTDASEKQLYRKKAIDNLAGGVVTTFVAATVFFLMLNPATAPIMAGIGIAASSVLAVHTVYKYRHVIAKAAVWMWNGLKSAFSAKPDVSKSKVPAKSVVPAAEVSDSGNDSPTSSIHSIEAKADTSARALTQSGTGLFSSRREREEHDAKATTDYCADSNGLGLSDVEGVALNTRAAFA